MDEVRFNSLEEVYTRLLPALTMAKNELKNYGLIFNEKDIWLYLKKSKWQSSKDLHLCFMVSDILNIKKEEIVYFMRVGDK